MMTPMAFALSIVLLGMCCRESDSFLRNFGSLQVDSLLQSEKSKTCLYGEMRILIHGTTNAYTTLRPYDLILYELEIKVKGKDRGIGVYTPENDILPLCNYEKGSTEFYIDKLQDAYCAETLKRENRLLRIVSADRRGTECFTVEEYLDTDIFIPVRNPEEFPVESAEAVEDGVSDSAPQSEVVISGAVAADSIEELNSKIEIAKYDYQLLQLKSQREISKLESRLADLRGKNKDFSIPNSSEDKTLVAVETSASPKAVGPYSQAVKANGFVFVSGCVGLDMETGRLADGGVEAETRQSLDNLKNIIEASGSSMSKVCKVTIMMRDMSYFATVNKIYSEYFNLTGGSTVLPARCTFEVSFLPLGAFIEIDATCLL